MRNIKNDATFLSAKAYEELKRSIVHGELKAGVRLTETSRDAWRQQDSDS